MNIRVKKGDTIVVISGKEKGREAKAQKVYPKDGLILVEGLNQRKVHRRPRRAGEKGSIISRSFPFQIGKVMPKCPHCSKATRVGFKVYADGKKARVCKKCKAEF